MELDDILLGAESMASSKKRKAESSLPQPEAKRKVERKAPVSDLPITVVTPEEEEVLRHEMWIMFGGPPPSKFFPTFTAHCSEPKGMSDLSIIASVEEAKVATGFLKLHTVLAVDCEWAYSREPDAPVRANELCLVQISTPEKQVHKDKIEGEGKGVSEMGKGRMKEIDLKTHFCVDLFVRHISWRKGTV